MNNKFYITTTLPYVNAEPHIGFALEIVQADAVARYQSLLGKEVFFNFGTDEHGQKIYNKALEEGKDPQTYVNLYAQRFDDLKKALNLSYNNFIRTTDNHHVSACQEFWKICYKNGFIEKGIYKAKYCVGCELEKKDSELENGRCLIHPNLEIELIEEENYFFKFSLFEKKLLDLYKKFPDLVVPKHRLKEISNFVEKGLTDFSISRLKNKMPWGVPVPNDDNHVMYVWFDALVNYISALGWPSNQEKFEDFWGTQDRPNALQVAGKDNLRQQSAMWQAMLMAAGLPATRKIFIHGFITSGGKKISKSLGNIVDPFEYVKKYSTDALRYYLLAKISPADDSDFTKEKFEEVYNGDLANELGNLVARIAKLCETANLEVTPLDIKNLSFYPFIPIALDSFKFDEALSLIWKKLKEKNQQIETERPWENIRGKNQFLIGLVTEIREIAFNLEPFLPETSEKILKQFRGPKIISESPLFPRLTANKQVIK